MSDQTDNRFYREKPNATILPLRDLPPIAFEGEFTGEWDEPRVQISISTYYLSRGDGKWENWREILEAVKERIRPVISTEQSEGEARCSKSEGEARCSKPMDDGHPCNATRWKHEHAPLDHAFQAFDDQGDGPLYRIKALAKSWNMALAIREGDTARSEAMRKLLGELEDAING